MKLSVGTTLSIFILGALLGVFMGISVHLVDVDRELSTKGYYTVPIFDYNITKALK